MIYLDNAATTWPKPPSVRAALAESLETFGANPGRGGHSMSLQAGRMVLNARVALASFFGSPRPERWIYTAGATDSINMALFGLLSAGDHVVTSGFEHNAAARPLHYLARHGVQVSIVAEEDLPLAQQVQNLLRPQTKLVVVAHASNVTGIVQPLQPVIDVCREAEVHLLVDAAQTAGLLPIDVSAGIDLLAVPGHKSLYGPPGIGALYVSPQIDLRPTRFGGTGSQSENLEQPLVYPDRLESGTLNTPGIYALNAGLHFVVESGVQRLCQQEIKLAQQLVDGLRSIPELTVYGWGGEPQVPVVACNLADIDSTQVAIILDQSFHICARAGLHCAPQAHHQLGTLQQGVVRFSVGAYNTQDEISQTILAMREIANELR